MDAKDIKRFSKYSIPQLRKMAGVVFRKFIRERDKGKKCISCPSYNITDASHYYSAGHYPMVPAVGAIGSWVEIFMNTVMV